MNIADLNKTTKELSIAFGPDNTLNVVYAPEFLTNDLESRLKAAQASDLETETLVEIASGMIVSWSATGWRFAHAMPSQEGAGDVPVLPTRSRSPKSANALETAPELVKGDDLEVDEDGWWLLNGIPVVSPKSPGVVPDELKGRIVAYEVPFLPSKSNLRKIDALGLAKVVNAIMADASPNLKTGTN